MISRQKPKGRTFAGLGLAAFAGVSLWAAAAVAQSDEDVMDPPSAPLNLPTDIKVFGPSDPQIRKATAIVNSTIITDTDIDQRLALVLAANGGKVEGEERERLKLQVLRNLIDETLEIQEAKANDIVITPEEINQTFSRVAGNFKRKPADFSVYLRQVGSSERSIKRQIEGELAWRRVLGRKVDPFVSVSDEEVKAVLDRLNASKGATEYRIGEIFLSTTPETARDTQANAEKIIEQIRKGGSFVAYARQYSEASTAAVGGDLGWVRAEQLPDPLAQAAQAMATGTISQPIAVPGGFSVIALIDKRQVLTADPRDATLSLKQISISFTPGMTQAQATPEVETFAKAMRGIAGCGAADDVAKTVKAEVVNSDGVKIRDLPPALQEMMAKLSIGQATPPFGSVKDGVRSLVLCGRDEAAAANGPSAEEISSRMEEERVNRRARRYLRDLRRDAVVEYR